MKQCTTSKQVTIRSKPASRKAVWEARGPPHGRSSISNPTWGWKLRQSSQTHKKKGVWGALGTPELPERLRFQDLAVKRKFNLNLIEGQTQGHPALANQNKSFLSNCVYKHWAQAMRRRSSTRQASASLLWSRETVKEQRFNSYPEVTRYKNPVRLRPPRRALRGKPHFQRERITDVLDMVQVMGETIMKHVV